MIDIIHIQMIVLPQFVKMISLYEVIFWLLGLLHLRAGLAYVMNPNKKDTYISTGYSVGMTKDMGAHLFWLGLMLIALAFVTEEKVQIISCILLAIGLIVPSVAELQNIKKGLQSTSTYPRIILKLGFAVLSLYLFINLL